MMAEDLRMFTAEEVGELLGMRVNHVHDLRKIGVLEAIKTGRSYMFSRGSILEFQERYKGKDMSTVKSAVASMYETKKASDGSGDQRTKI